MRVIKVLVALPMILLFGILAYPFGQIVIDHLWSSQTFPGFCNEGNFGRRIRVVAVWSVVIIEHI